MRLKENGSERECVWRVKCQGTFLQEMMFDNSIYYRFTVDLALSMHYLS